MSEEATYYIRFIDGTYIKVKAYNLVKNLNLQR